MCGQAKNKIRLARQPGNLTQTLDVAFPTIYLFLWFIKRKFIFCFRDDAHILSMFEVVLSTMESKLQKVEGLDRAVHHLMRRMETMERRISAKTAEVLTAVQKVQCNRVVKVDDVGEESEDNNEQLLAQPSNRQSRVLTASTAFNLNDRRPTSIEDVKEVINGIDRRLGLHINIVSENLGKMSNMVEEVRQCPKYTCSLFLTIISGPRRHHWGWGRGREN